MTSTCKSSLQHFFRNVMMCLGHHGWTLRLREGHEGYCWRNQKRIDVGMNCDGDLRQGILHEIAHIDTAKYCNQSHNPQFWKRAEYLIKRFLKTGLDENEVAHRRYCSNGVYGLVYKT